MIKENIKERKFNKRWVPYQWPWTDRFGEHYLTFSDWFKSRAFSITYLIIIWLLWAVLGYASRSNCQGSWQIEFMCELTLWVDHFLNRPLHYLLTCFTTAWFHNDFVHILFVTIFGFAFPVQSYEAQFGTKNTIAIYFASYLFAGLFIGVVFNSLSNFESFRDSSFVLTIFTRSWMGGSVGVFGILGALSYFSSKKWFLWSMIFVFELFNYFIIGNNEQISFIHISGATFGWGYCWVWEKYFNQGESIMKLRDAKLLSL